MKNTHKAALKNIDSTKREVGLEQCSYCKEWFEKKKMEKDHIIPVSKGGKDTEENLTYACRKCNMEKSNTSVDDFLKKKKRSSFKKSSGIRPNKREKSWNKKDWKESEFSKLIRIKGDKWDYIDATKGRKSLAGRLDQILEDYLKMEIEQKGGAIE